MPISPAVRGVLMKIEELSKLIRDVEPAAVLVAPAVLERVIQNVTGTSWVVWQVPHGRCFLVDRSTLFRHVEQEELYLPPDHLLPDIVLLLERPTADRLGVPKGELLGEYWRLLFHITLHREIGKTVAEVPPAGIRERIDALGPAAFEEARNVLRHDSQLVADADDKEVYIEFVGTYYELKFFAANLIPVYFPSLPSASTVENVFGKDVDAAKWFKKTHLTGSPAPVPKTDDQADESHDYYYRLDRSARRSAASGDTVLAAIQQTKAARVAPAALTSPAQAAARQHVYTLINRLKPVLNLSDDEVEAWKKVLPALLDKADQGNRPVEAALLYDLQRACLDHEQTIYTLDIFEWLLSAGYKPIRRPLDGQKFVRVPNHLRNAVRRLTAARLTDADRQSLGALLRDALDRSEDRLRQRFRPVLTDALHDAGMRPTSLPEQAAVAKTVEELLDRISAAGFLGFPDVRDAIARGMMKLPDLSGPQEYLRGDPLLRLDRRLATLLDGVYRRGEFYVRWLERMTSFNFGTETGRWITRNVSIPIGGAFLAAQFAWLIVYEQRTRGADPIARPASGEVVAIDGFADGLAAAVGTAAASAEVGPNGFATAAKPTEGFVAAAAAVAGDRPSFFSGWNAEWWFHLGWLALAVFFLALVRSAALRTALMETGRVLYRAGRVAFWDVPARLWANPFIRGLLTSGPMHLILNYLVKPVVLGLLLWFAFRELWDGVYARGFYFLFSLVLINTRLGRAVEAILLAAASWFLRGVRSAPAVIRWVSDIFRHYVDQLEWLLARGDDWFRLRGQGGTLSILIRMIAGAFWFPIAFVIRFYIVVLIEPMLNPLKLPLSILFAKFVYPLLLVIGWLQVDKTSWVGFRSDFVDVLAPYMTQPLAFLFVIGTFYLLPDAVTFLFWEMRENWRLYRANRPLGVRPVSVGPHGETVGGLLHLGFHSGRVPRLFGRLRTAERAAAETGVWRDVRTHRQALRDVEESVRRFVTRDLVAVLAPSPGWENRPLAAGRVQLGTNRIRVELLSGNEPSAWLEFEDRSGWLVAGWAVPGWLTSLTGEPRRVFANALTYLYKRAGVGLVREHVQAELPKTFEHFDVAHAGLLVWYGNRESTPVLYDLAHRADDLRPRTPDNLNPAPGPTLDADRVMFERVVLTWPQWVEVWQADREGRPGQRFGPSDYSLVLLPPADEPPPETHLSTNGT